MSRASLALSGALLAAALAACGGGTNDVAVAGVGAASSPGGAASGASGAASAPVVATSLAGTAAVGAPMAKATITVKDAKGAVVSAAVGDDGAYASLSLDGLTAPYAVQACGLVSGNFTCYYAVVQAGGTANVTPLTNAAVALALGDDPAKMFAATGAIAPPTAAAIDAQVVRIKQAMADMLARAGLSAADFATTPFAADRTGMDKLLDAIKVSVATDGASGKVFVQLETKLGGSGNVYLAATSVFGALVSNAGFDVDMKGISKVFVGGLSYAVSAPTEAECATRMAAADIFDDAFTLDMDQGVFVTKAQAPAMLCQFMGMQGLLGGAVANPALESCDFTTDPAARTCVAGFNIVKGEAAFEGAELAIVLRTGQPWRLLGRDSPYDINISSAAQRTVRVDVPAGDPRAAAQYTRALQFDVKGLAGTDPVGVRAARVYQHSIDGSTWEPAPIATLTLTDACIAQFGNREAPRLGIVGAQSCGASWQSLGDTGAAAGESAAGDVLIENFYKRGRKVRVDLYANVDFTGTPVSVEKFVNGVPPKFAAMASFPWLELDATTRAALAAYDGSKPTFTLAWLANGTVSAHDATMCLAGDCQGASRAGHVDILLGHTGQAMPVDHPPAGADAFRMINLYGRDHDQANVSTNYISCGGAASCFK